MGFSSLKARIKNLWELSAVPPEVIKDFPKIQFGEKAEFIMPNRVEEIMKSTRPTIDQLLIKE